MKILGIETSCDETAVAIVEDGRTVLSNTITSTKDIFSGAGGVVPEDAARRQVECMLPVLRGALEHADCTWSDIDCIAVTKGPGLMGCLLVGTTLARTLASIYKKPLIGVHHTFGHLSSTWLTDGTAEQDSHWFPSITLSASGGHTDLWYRTSHTTGKLLGRTRDDAAGEAYDKGASMLGLPYPGGPSISKASEHGNESAFAFPLALQKEDTLDYSFSGLKTALKTTIAKQESLEDEALVCDLAASYQYAINNQLCDRIERAIEQYADAKSIHIVGGVSANTALRSMVSARVPLELKVPEKILYCTDNAAMIASAAYFLQQEKGKEAYSAFETRATLPLEDCVCS